jgi:hypothetical protein
MIRSALETAIYAYLHRASFRSPVPDFDAVKTFVQLAQEDINGDLRARCMIERGIQPVDGRYLPLPCDYIEATDIRWAAADPTAYPQSGELTYSPRSAVATIAGRPAAYSYASSGGPLYYDVVGDMMEIWPFPAAADPTAPPAAPAYSIEMAYFARQDLGPNPTDTTPVLSELPSIYLWGALSKSAPFLRDDDRVAVWQANYVSAVARANIGQERARTQGSRLVQKFRRVG